MIGVRKDSGVIRLLMAAALVLFVAACSTTDNTAKRERDQAQMERDEAQMERDEAQMERDEAQMERDEAQQEVVNLSGSLEELRGQLAALQESGTDADQATIDALMAEIARLEEVEKEAMDAEAAAKKASILALFKGLDKRINPENAGGVADPTALVPPLARFDVGHTDGTAENNMRLSVNHGKATKVTPATAGTTSPMNNKLADAAGMLSDSAHEGWSSTMVNAQDSGTKNTDTVVVYTDISTYTEEPFADLFLQPGVDGQPGTEGGAPNDVRTIQTGDAGRIVSDAFPTTAGVTVHDPNKADTTETVRIVGTFAGASGEYRCTETAAGTCTSQGTNKGVRLNGGWIFDPNEGAMAKDTDDEYSFFGWWWRVAPVTAGGGYDIDVFHGNMRGTDGAALVDTEVAALTGTATYVGPAAGKFAISPQLPNEPVMGGHWDATATLTVDFEEGEAPAVAEISGSVHDFMQDGNALPFDVALPKTGVGAVADGTAAFDNDGVAWSIDGEKSSDTTGEWSGNLWNRGRDQVPTSVTGEFQAVYNDEVGRIEGAFGARKQ